MSTSPDNATALPMAEAASIPSVNSIRTTIVQHFPQLWSAVELGLSTCATLLLSDNANPVALIYVGPASAGKTTVVSMFEGASMCYRSDKFTPASFVSQSAKATSAQLNSVDLLPRIRHKVLLTPELATIFRGKVDELSERFSTITRVMDGQGLKTDSGTHGQRGYEGDYLFAWLGATTPFDPIVWKVMAQLGSRMFFLMMDAASQPSVAELVAANVQSTSYKEDLETSKQAIKEFIEALFRSNEDVRGVQWKKENDPKDVLEIIAQLATLLALMRTPFDSERQVKPESPHRANSILYNLARGHALVCGRRQLALDDLPGIAEVALSSMPVERAKLLSGLASSGTSGLVTQEVQDIVCVKSHHTAHAWMEELDWLGIASFEKPGDGKSAYLRLKQEWEWCRAGLVSSLIRKVPPTAPCQSRV